MSMSASDLYLKKPLPATAAVAAWPGVMSRALSREEREWLEAVPVRRSGTVDVEALGVTSPWVRRFFVGFVEHALRRGKATVRREPGALVAELQHPVRVHRVSLVQPPDGGPARPGDGAQVPTRRTVPPRTPVPVKPAARGTSFFCPGTHASHSMKDDD